MIITDLLELRKQNDIVLPSESEEIIKILEKELIPFRKSGVGLAAPQIGIHKRVAIIRTNNYSINLVNPIIIDKENSILINGEGCLSIPNVRVNTWRFGEVFFKSDVDPNGIVVTGIEALAVQHEIDHLDGILMIDRSASNGVGRNDLCPCGKKIKFKKCHGK